MRPAVCVVLVAAAAGCGGTGVSDVPISERLRQLERDPYGITCGDEARSNHLGKRAYFALADAEHIPHINRLRAAHSIFYAVQELCRGKPASYKPAKPAVEGVRSGRYRARPGADT